MIANSHVPAVPCAALLLFLVAVGGSPQPAVGQTVDGWSVTGVEAGHGRKTACEYRQVGDRAWREIPSTRRGNAFDFDEVGRDHAAVYLHDATRDVEVTIDLGARKIFYSDATASSRELYDVLSSSSRANGLIVRYVSYGQGGRRQGEYRQTGDRTWREANTDATYDFVETGRDEGSVYLNDASRDVMIRIDLDGGKIFFRDSRSSWRELYDVLGSSAQANGWLVRRVSYGQGGRTLGEFRQTGDGFWQELSSSSGGDVFDFAETGRDDASVFLRDPSRQVEIHIDLAAGKIYYRDAGTLWREFYDVRGASL